MAVLTPYWVLDALAVLATLLVGAYLYTARNFRYWKKRGVEQLTPSPIFGNFGDIFFHRKSCGEFVREVYENYKGLRYVGFYFFDQPHLMILDPDLVKQVLIRDFNYFPDRFASPDVHDRIGASNLFMIKNPAWKSVRQKLTPIYTSGKVKKMFELMRDVGNNLDKYLESLHLEGTGQDLEMKELSAKFMTDMIASTAFGLQVNSLANPDAEFRKFGRKVFDFSGWRGYEFMTIFFYPVLVKLLQAKFFGKETTQFFRSVFWETINHRMQSGEKRNDLIDTLVELNKKKKENAVEGFEFDGDDLLSQAAVFFTGGFETTSLATSFTLYEIALNSEIQTKLRREIHDALEETLVLGGDPKGKNFLYTNGNSVIIRNIDNPAISDIYTEHSCAVNVAKYSPSGFYIASGDQSGKIRIWDTVNKEHILKNEFHPIGGPIKDIAWSPDSQRMVVVGEGRERFGHVFMAETGTSVGEISGQSKPINSCDFRSARPFRLITGSEDNTIAIFEGPPFKFKMTKQEHTRFVQAVRYSPNGNLFASAGFDGKVFIYDGTTSELVGEVGSPAHQGGVYAVSWKPDGTQLLTASGDKTCKLFDVETRTVISEFNMGATVDDQQVSCLWQGNHLLSVSLSGFINYLDVNNPEKPIRIIKGHNKPITVLTLSPDRSTIYTGSHDGYVTNWNAETGENDRVQGQGHGNQINGMKASNNLLYTAGIDDTLRAIDIATNTYAETSNIKLDSQPRGLDIYNDLVVTASIRQITVVQNNKKVSSLPIDFEPSSVSINQGNADVAVGSTSDNKVHIYELSGTTLTPKTELEHLGPVTDVSYSPDNNFLVACDANRKVILYVVPEYKFAHDKEWGFHNARVNSVAWCPDSSMVASGSLDTTIIIWSVTNPAKHTIIKNAHPQSQITRLVWLDEETLISVGQDCNTKIWRIEKI